MNGYGMEREAVSVKESVCDLLINRIFSSTCSEEYLPLRTQLSSSSSSRLNGYWLDEVGGSLCEANESMRI